MTLGAKNVCVCVCVLIFKGLEVEKEGEGRDGCDYATGPQSLKYFYLTFYRKTLLTPRLGNLNC